MALSQAQLDQRRANGRALAEKVDREYFRFLGRRGGRRFVYNQIMRVAQNFEGFGCEPKCSPERFAEIVADMKAHYQEQAQRYYDYTGNRVMVDLFAPGFEAGNAAKNRLKVPKPSGRTPRRYYNATGVVCVLNETA